MNIREKAFDFASKAHSGQTRWDKNIPYISHPILVAQLAEEKFRKDERVSAPDYIEVFSEYIYIVGIGHDIEEDTKCNAIEYLNYLNLDDGLVGEILLESLDILNKNNYDNYLDFVLAAKDNMIAKYVKWADITHNLSDTKKKGSIQDKYLLAKYILEN